MTAIELFGFAPSTYVRTARLVCEEKGIQYELKPLEFQAESHRALHPYLKMPALRHGNVTLYETLAIALYLNEDFPGVDLEAGTAIGRAHMFQWISVANDCLYSGIVGHVAGAKDAQSLDMSVPARLLAPVDAALAKSPFLAGDELTLADLFLLPMLLYAEDSVGQRDWLAAFPDILHWLDKLQDRESVTNTGTH